MLGICFFIQRGEYTGEPLWAGEKGMEYVESLNVQGRKSAAKCSSLTTKNQSAALSPRALGAQLPRPAAAFGLLRGLVVSVAYQV
jgi:hypothetical protein